MLYDGFLFRRDKDDFLVECDEQVGIDLFYHLQQHKLRAKVRLADLSKDFRVEAWWNLPSLLDGPELTITDPRGALGLLRSIAPRAEAADGMIAVDVKWYDLLRYAAGIAEGPLEMRRLQAIPLEYNLDWLGAVAFDKGCYLGQELMARTHFRGTIRKRLLPFKILADAGADAGGDCQQAFQVRPEGVEGIPSGAELYAVSPPEARSMSQVQAMEVEGQALGKVVSSLGNVGLAVIRLPSWTPGHRFAVHRPTPGASDQRQFLLVEPYKPHWWPRLDPNDLQ